MLPNYDDKAGIYYGSIHQNSLSGDALDDVWQRQTDLTLARGVAELRKKFDIFYRLYSGTFRCDASMEALFVLLEDITFSTRVGELRNDVLHELDDKATGYDTAFDLLESALVEHYDCDNPDWEWEGDGYFLTKCLNYDIFVIRSPYYTFARECSPCVPNAGDLNTTPGGVKCYCLGPDWFEDEKNPYDIYDVKTQEKVYPQRTVRPPKEDKGHISSHEIERPSHGVPPMQG